MSENVAVIENEDEVETPGNVLHDFVQAAIDNDYNKAGKVFGDVMTIKLVDLLGQEEIKVADQMFNGDPDDDESDVDLEDEDLEDDEDEEYDEPEEETEDE